MLILLTFEALSSSLLQKALFLAVVRNVTRILGNVTKRMHLELPHGPQTVLVEFLKRRIHQPSLYLSLRKHRSIFTHL